MNIIHIATALSWRGGEQQVAYLVEELHQKGLDQLIICSAGSAMESYCQLNNHKYRAIRKRSSFDLNFAYRIKQVSNDFRPTHIHIHDAHAHTLAILSAVFFNNKINIVLSRRVDFPVKKNWMSRFKYNHKLVKKIVCVSDEIKRITAVSIQDKRKLCTVYSGVDLTKFSTTKGTVLRKEFGIADDVKIIGNTSAIADHKDYFTFVDAAKQILNSNNGVVFLIIGDGPDKEKIQAYVKKQQLDKKILFTGFRQDVPAILPELAVFLMTSKTEGLGTSLLDAMACGVPIVTTDAGGIPEIVIAQENGLLCSVGNAEQLAGNTINILENEALRTQLIEGGLKKVQQFSKEVTAEKTFEVYKEVVAS